MEKKKKVSDKNYTLESLLATLFVITLYMPFDLE